MSQRLIVAVNWSFGERFFIGLAEYVLAEVDVSGFKSVDS
jgi:hypothetical protein